ncbi:hypothetical protein DAD186_08900 [Dermabacter vaginalis]|uniref:DUF4870 domain-containing protein n=1 Tax=Dermabacter vaginalis TaxID=1630135 RepID=A0A1B0ZHP6_9MICO|nr:DUF4870 domain-containing protein [Dermabacter vaginalis]ANP27440.1 hypothetical protein DAD186_08900 [Dermabacter vaginalis]
MSDQPSNPYGFSNPTSGNKGTGASGFGGPTGPGGVTSDERTWAILAHLSALVATVVSVGWLGWVGPLVIYLLYRDKSPFVRNASAGALNFAINLFVYSVIAWGFFFIGTFLSFLLVPLLFVVIAAIIGLAVFVATIVVPIIAAMKANNGEAYTYPFTVSIIK